MPKVSISEAARLIGQSRTPLYKAINRGVLTTGKNKLGQTVVDTEQVFRLFPPAEMREKSNENKQENALRNGSGSLPHAKVIGEPGDIVQLSAALADKEAQIKALRAECDQLKRVIEAKVAQKCAMAAASARSVQHRDPAAVSPFTAMMFPMWWMPWGFGRK